jgi:hypothetical protein
MKRIVLSLVPFVLFCLAISSNIYASNRIVYDTFNSQSWTQGTFGSVGEDSSTTDPSSWQSDGSGGYCRQSTHTAGSGGQPSRLMFSPGQNWPTDTVFVRYKMRFTHWSGSGSSNPNVKYFRLYKDSSHLYWHMANQSTNAGYILFNTNSNGSCGGACQDSLNYTMSGLADGNWHTLAFLLTLSTGNGKFWYDRDPSLSPSAQISPSRTDWGDRNFMYLVTPADQGGTGDIITYTRQYDNVEIWDGMPGQDQSPPPPPQPQEPSAPSGLKVIN